MKVLKEAAVQCECGGCGSLLEVSLSDTYVGWAGARHFICPVCGYEDIAEGLPDEKLTIDTLSFPEHFHHVVCSSHCVHLPKSRINEYIDEVADLMREDEDWAFTGTGDTMVYAFRKDGECSVFITQDYYEGELSFTAPNDPLAPGIICEDELMSIQGTLKEAYDKISSGAGYWLLDNGKFFVFAHTDPEEGTMFFIVSEAYERV